MHVAQKNFEELVSKSTVLQSQLIMEKEYSSLRPAEIEQGRQQIQKFKVALEDQLVIAEKQREKIIRAKEDEANL